MKNLFLALLLATSLGAQAHMTSDVSLASGLTALTMKTAGNTVTLTSMASIYFTFNLNHPASKMALTLEFMEAPNSSQGPLAWTRLGAGAKYYLTGFNAQRVVFDNHVEGMYWRPAPYIGGSLGLSTFSISNVGGLDGYFNAAVVDAIARAGAEVVLSSSLFLIGELNVFKSLLAQGSRTSFDLSYAGLGVYVGLKIVSF